MDVGASGRSAVRWKRTFAWAFTLVVVFFLTETLVSQLLASAIGDAAARIATDFAPSVVALASARSELHRLYYLTNDYVDDDGGEADRARLDASRAELDRAIATYVSLPFIPGERELWTRVVEDISLVRSTLERTCHAVERGDMNEARLLARRASSRQAVDRAGTDILSDIELNGRAADDDAVLIARRRRESLSAAAALAAASVALTVVVALLIYRLTAQNDALQRERANVLREANAELEIFASRLSHDIVSPLASTRFAIDAALKAERDERIQRILQRGSRGLDRAARIAHALLEFARAGARPDPTERGDVRRIVAEVVEEFRSLAERTGARLETTVPAQATVACDEALVTAALSNLVRNALTYLHDAPEKRVDILAADAGDRVRIEVRDTGPGLPPGAEAAIFEPYVRGPGVTQPGLGLGLATVKRIVDAHRGAVGVSPPGRGVPLLERAAERVRPPANALQRGGRRPMFLAGGPHHVGHRRCRRILARGLPGRGAR